MLQTTGAAAAVSALAGCLGGSEDDDGETVIQPGEGMVEIDYDDIVEGGTLRTSIGSAPPNWDPPQIGDTTSNMVCGVMVYEGLLTTDYEGQIHPWLATDWEEIEVQDITSEAYEDYMVEADEQPDILEGPTEDGMVLTTDGAQEAAEDGVFGMQVEFSIREGVQFHDGDELTAEHFVRSLDRWVGANRWGVEMVDWFLHAEATDDHTLVLYAQLPDADFYYNIGHAVFPEQYWDAEPGDVNPLEGNDPIGTGVWQFEEYEDESHIILRRFDDHWFDPEEYEENHPDDDFELVDGFPERPPVEEIDYEIIPEDPSRSAALQDGIVDHAFGLASDTLSDFDDSEEFRVSAVTSGGYLFFEYPNQQEPWDDPRVCRGVNHMIPRPQIVDTVFDGWQTEAAIPLSPTSAHAGVHDYDAIEEDLGHYNEYDPDAGAELVQEAFDEHGIEAPFETEIITNSDNDDRVDTVGLIAESMENSGLFEVEINTYEWGRFVEMLVSGELWENNQIITVGLSSGWTPDGYARAVSHPDNQGGACCNHTHYENDEVTELIDGARYGPDVVGEENIDNRRDTYEQLWETLLEDPPVSWVSFGMEDDILRDDVVKGWNAYPFNSSKYSAAMFNPPAGQVTWVEEDDD